jgi:hypothetical protein
MGSSSKPAQSVQTQVRQEYPAFFKPHLETVLQGASDQFQREYTPFDLPRLVETPQARTDALTALQADDLAALSKPQFEQALALTGQAAQTFPESNIADYMNPYTDLVTKNLLRKAAERRGIDRKKISDSAARAGAFGGSRHGMSEAMFDRTTDEQLQDIEDRANMANFSNAMQAMQADKTRGLSAALQTANLGDNLRKALIEGQIGKERAATAEEALAQKTRDVGFQEFQEQLTFPQQKLNEYSAIIRGHTPPTNVFQNRDIQVATSPLQQVAGVGTALAGLTGFGAKQGGPVKYNEGKGVSSASGINNIIQDLTNLGKSIGGTQEVLRDTGESLRLARDMGESRAGRYPTEEVANLEEDWTLAEDWNVDPDTGDSYGDIMLGKGFEKKPRYQPKNFAYGGVPGQPYTEDIGTVGGLASIAGPQMRFAYGGVPGQPYTEDIGMVGGLGAVAGPQLRFAPGGAPSPFKAATKTGGLYGLGKLSDMGKRVARSGDKRIRPIWHGDVYGEETKDVEHLSTLPLPHTTSTRKNPSSWWDGFVMAADPTGSYSKDILNDPKRLKDALQLTKTSDEKVEDVEEVSTEEWSGADMLLTDPSVPKEIPKVTDTPKVKEAKNKEAEKKWGPNWKLVAAGMAMMDGTDKGLQNASKLIAQMDTEDDKLMNKLKMDYMKSRSQAGRMNARTNMLKAMYDRQFKTADHKRKLWELDNKIKTGKIDSYDKMLKQYPDIVRMQMFEFSEKDLGRIEGSSDPNAMKMHILNNKLRNLFAAIETPSDPPPAKPEEPSLIDKLFGKAEGGSIPTSLRNAGVTSIRKI